MTTPDLLSRAGANALCRTIVAYWSRRGHTVTAEPYELPGHEDNWGVRSNLVAGLPPYRGR